jgi:filamentous hemagglutinin family protein
VFLLAGADAPFGTDALAQLTPDNTLGAENSVVTPLDQLNEKIDGGAMRGANLFHSFQDFNVGAGRGVYFANPLGIQNILSRVTGGNPSNILGRLGVLGNANLFLLNPNGIVFGPNASLDIKGSFLATTADAIKLGDSGLFSASQPQTSSLLSVSPGALFFNQVANQPGAITNSGNLVTEQNLTLSADNLDLQGQLHAGGNLTLQAQDTVKVRDHPASPFIASAGGQLLVQGDQGVDIFALNYSESGFYSGGDMVLRSAAAVSGDAHYTAGGNFRIEQLDGTLGNLFSDDDPIIRATGDVFLNAYQGASLHIFAGGYVYIPDTVRITNRGSLRRTINPTTTPAEANVSLSDGTPLVINGNASPTVDIRAGTKAVGSPFVNTGTPTSADIIIGDIVLDAIGGDGGKVFLTNQYQPNPALTGNITVGFIDPRDDFGGGSVAIDSKGSITLNDQVNAFADSLGNGGDITLLANDNITTGSLSAFSNNSDAGAIHLTSRNGAIDTSAGILNASTNGRNGGAITLQANGDITTFGIRSDGGRFGGSGNIILTSRAGTVSATDGFIISDTYGTGDAGDISISAPSVLFNGGLVTSLVQPGAVGNGGSIRINTASLSVNGAELNTTTLGQGNSGSVTITASNTVSVDRGSSVLSLVGPGGVGNSGGIHINTGSLSVNNGAELNSSVTDQGRGSAGDVIINARDRVTFNGGFARSRLELGGVGRSGDIRIITGSLSLTGIPPQVADANIGQLVTATFGQGDAGNVIINARDRVSLDGRGSDIWTLVAQNRGVGNAGDIIIDSGSFSMTNGARLVSTTEQQGEAGDITINTAGTFSITNGATINTDTPNIFNAGNITVNANIFEAVNGGRLITFTRDKGRAGNITLGNPNRVINRVTLSGTDSGLFANTGNQSSGDGGNITLYAGSLSLTDGAQVSGSTSGAGSAGEILVQATESVTLSNNAQIRGTVETGATGNGNQIEIQARSLSLTNGAQVSASTSGQGKAGNIEIDVTDGVTISGTKTGVFASTENSIITPTPVGVAAREGDDAGQLLGTNRDLTTGSAGTVVTTISGTLANNNDVDLYKIFLAGNQTFSATTIGGSGVEDTQLYLFDERGIGVYANDDADRGGTYQSTLPAGNPLTPAVPGYYYLAISSYANAALSNGGEIFGDSSSTVGATGTGGSLPLSSWNNMGDESGAYSIKLVGTGVTVPQQVVQQGGDGGNITLRAGSLSVRDGAQLAATTSGGGNAGNVTINATNAVSFEGSSALTSVKSGATGNGGNLDVTARSLSLTNNSQLSASTSGKGDAGSIFVRDADTVSLDNNSQIRSAVEAGAIGNSQQINLQTRSLSLTNNSQLSASTSGQGDAGSIFVRDADTVSLDNNSQIRSAVEAGAIGNSQQINLQTRSLSLTNNSQLSASTSGQGDAGSIFVRDADTVSLDNNSQIRSAVEAGAIGNSQQINLQMRSLSLTNNAQLSASTSGQGNAGSIFVRNTDTVSLDNNSQIRSAVEAGAIGNSQQINLETRSLSLTNNAQLSASTSGQGNAGSIFVRDADTVSLDDSTISTAVNLGGKGEGGNVEITTGSLDLDNKALLSASTSGVGNTGRVSVQAQEAISLRNGSQISSSVESTAQGKGQQITLQARTLSLSNGAQVNATTSGQGDAGSIKVNTDEAVSLSGDNSRLSTRTNSGGKGGDIAVDTGAFRISQGAVLDATTTNAGNGGDITVNASTFDATSGGKLQATTSGSGRAGTITVNTADRVRVDGTGSGLFASTDANSTGDGGNINIDTTNLDLNNGAAISAQSDGKGTAGDITITARQAINSNRGEITANAASAGGGEITINTRNINLLNSSLISTSVANSDGGGGNIKITSDTFIALQDSDILANADAGPGGNIEINSPLFLADLFASGFGTAVGRNPGDFTQFRGNDRVDISASSRVGISGSVRIPDFSFLQNSLSQLSLNFVNPDQAIASSCLAHRNAKQGSFTLTGTGGLPYNPYEAMRGEYQVSEVQGLTPQEKQEASSPVSNPQSPILNSWKLGDPVQEAQGMTLTADGRILVGTTPQLAAALKAQDLICPAESNQVGR